MLNQKLIKFGQFPHKISVTGKCLRVLRVVEKSLKQIPKLQRQCKMFYLKHFLLADNSVIVDLKENVH